MVYLLCSLNMETYIYQGHYEDDLKLPDIPMCNAKTPKNVGSTTGLDLYVFWNGNAYVTSKYPYGSPEDQDALEDSEELETLDSDQEA